MKSKSPNLGKTILGYCARPSENMSTGELHAQKNLALRWQKVASVGLIGSGLVLGIVFFSSDDLDPLAHFGAVSAIAGGLLGAGALARNAECRFQQANDELATRRKIQGFAARPYYKAA